MELLVTSKGAGKFSVTDNKDRVLYTVVKARKLFGSPTTTLYDASGYTLYTMKRISAGSKPEYEVQLNDRFFMKVQCKTMFIDPCIQFENADSIFELKGKNHLHFELFKNENVIGTLTVEKQVNNEFVYTLNFEDEYFDDFFPLFAIAVDRCFGEINK